MAYTFKHGDRPLEGYTIQRGIGRGGFGEVYYAISDGGREVAIKYLLDNSEIELRGVSHCMNLKSPHLVTIFDVKKNDGGDYFIIMEHVSGPSLRELLIAEPKGLGLEKSAFFLRELGKGLGYLHDRGIVHRDMKPGNIFYEEGHVKIGDYGLSKFIAVSRHSAQTSSVGTIHYMAPEVGSGNYHRGIDIYALGVILYEMLLGKVPFEGSSMGEILMKHLTEQPEVQGLPHPFGLVIRKALQKDPKDRYQTVHEMIDDMLEVGDVRNSLAGFNPSTITAIPRPRPPFAAGVDSPVPSPNPLRPPQAFPPPPPLGIELGGGAIPKRVEKRLRRISERVERKLDKLAGRPHRPRPMPGPTAAADQGAGGIPRSGGFGAAFKRLVVSFMLTAVTSIGLGLLVGAANGMPVGAATGMMIGGLSFGLRLGPRWNRWLGPTADPDWVQRIVLLLCCGPFMCVASAPVFAEYDGRAFGPLLGLLVMVLTANWNERRESGAAGELSFGRAFGLALWGGLLGLIGSRMSGAGDPESFGIMGAAVGGAVSLLTQALAWFLQKPTTVPRDAGREPGSKAHEENVARAVTATDSPPPHPQSPPWDARRENVPFAIPVEAGMTASGTASSRPVTRLRSGFARGLYSVFAFVMLFAVVASIIFLALAPPEHDDEVMGLIVLAVGSFSMILFALQKLTMRKRPGFWRETLCPFLIAVFMTTLGASIASIGVFPLEDDELAFAVVGIVFSSLAVVALFIMRLWPYTDELDQFVGQVGREADAKFMKGLGLGVGAAVLPDDGFPPGDGQGNAAGAGPGV